MRIYTYAVIDSNSKITAPINGLEEVGVYNIPYRDIGIVVSEGEQIHPVRDKTPKVSNGLQDISQKAMVRLPIAAAITQEHILKHEEVVEKLMESFTVLPVSFLTLFKKEDDVLLMMQEHYSDFRENLDRLRNKVEFGIKIIWPGETIKNRIIEASKKFNPSTTLRIDGERRPSTSLRPSPEFIEGRSRTINSNFAIADNSPGKSFAMQKLEKYKIDKEFAEEADRCIALLDDFFSRFVAEKRLEKLKSDNLLLNAYYLVEKEKQGDFKEAFERAKNTPGDLKYLFSGPWPPYNFISLTKKPSSLDYLNTKDAFTKLVNNLDLTEKNII